MLNNSSETRAILGSAYNELITAPGVTMAEKHFKQLGLGSFFGSPIYERVVPRDHFLVQLNAVIDWASFTEILLPAYKGLAEEGRPPYPPGLFQSQP